MLNACRDVARSPLTNAGIRSIIRRVEDLPVLPSVAVQALTLSLQDDAALDQLSVVVESDPVLTARILKLVNNARTGLPSKVNTVKQAVTLAGLNQVRCALLGVVVRDYLPAMSAKMAQAARQLWVHSLMTAVAGHLVAQRCFPELRDQAFVAGLLHDIGKVVIMDVFPEIAMQIDTLKGSENLSSLEAEQRVLDMDHSVAGRLLAQQWKLPDALVDCIWLHHHEPDVMGLSSVNSELVWIVCLANILAKDIFGETPQELQENGFRSRVMKALNLKTGDLEGLKRAATDEYAKKAGFFDLESDLNTIYQNLLQKANSKLSSLATELDHKNSVLTGTNTFLELIHRLGLELGKVRTREDLFNGVVQVFQGFSPVPLGVFYVVEMETRELEGIVWIDGGRRRRLLCFTDRQGDPVWEYDDQGLPADLRTILAKYKQRMQDVDRVALNTKAPFYMFSFGKPGQYFAELCISLNQEFKVPNCGDVHAFTQVGHLLRSAMENVRLLERLHMNQEDLSRALLKNQQVNQQLIQTERLAAVGQLAAGAAHEINNPLAIISARAQLLELKEQDEKRKHELSVICKQIDRISKILSNLMDFARPVPPKLRDVNIHTILDRVLELMGNGFGKHGISVRKDYDPGMVAIKADPNQLEQVFLNLVINARHAMEKGGGELAISTHLAKDGATVAVKVRDQGTGISRDNMKRIFDPFFTTKEEGKGTGLGLSTSVGIINSHFGKVDIESQLGKGTVFSVELPVDITALRPSKGCGESSVPSVASARPNVLVVDDEEHIRDILKETLENENFSVKTARNGQEALILLAKETYDLMLLDIKMPFRNGLSVLREIRKQEMTLPVIVITGMASHEEIEEARSYGVCACIRKPFHIKTLLAEVRNSLASSHG